MQNNKDSNLNIKELNIQSGSQAIHRKNSYIIIFIAVVIGCLNVLFLTNFAASMAIIAVELCILLYFLLKKNITGYLGFYLIFLSLSFEFEQLLGFEQFYGFKNFRILGLNLGILALLPILLFVITKGIKVKKIKFNYPMIYRFSLIILFMNMTGIILGLFQIFINENNVQNIGNFMNAFTDVTYNMMAIPFLLICSVFYIFSWEEERLVELEKFLIAILVGVIISMVVSLLTGSFGRYGGVDTLLVTNLVIYTPFILLIPLYKDFKYKKSILFLGLVGMVLSIIYNASGKLIILYSVIPFLMYNITLKQKKILTIIFATISIPIIVSLIVHFVNVVMENSILFTSKLNEAFSILWFWKPDWFLDMPLSPRTRIIEFISITIEYLHKPWFLLFGKGYMGTFTDHTGMLAADFVQGAFSIEQWIIGAFYAPHETLNVLFLYHGILGVIFYFYILMVTIRNYTRSPWILIGGFWFLMFYGYSVTLSAFGITALLIGYSKISRHIFNDQ
jgi:hypothetical protein